jgi:UDP-N-acetylmuramyl tripeptide synthase
MEDLRAGDTLLVLGKARDESQLVMGAKEPFSDREVVLRAARRT